MDTKKMAELLKESKFVEELKNAGSAEEAQKLFAARGLEVSISELNALRAIKAKQEKGEELSEEELALVAGGCVEKIWAIFKLLTS